MLEGILIGYGVVTVLAFLAWHNKPFWTTLPSGRRVTVKAPVGKFLIVAFIMAFVMVSIVPHIIFRFLGFRGFFEDKTGSYQLQNPFKRTRR